MNDTTIIVAVLSYLFYLSLIGWLVYIRKDSDSSFMEDCLFVMIMAMACAAITTAVFVNLLKMLVVAILLAVAFSVAVSVMWLFKKLFGDRK